MKITNTLASFLLVLFTTAAAFAQVDYVQTADNKYKEGNFQEAIPLYKKAYSKVKDKAKKAYCLFQIGECRRVVADFANAEADYSRAIKAGYTEPIAILYYAQALKANGKYPEAMIEYTKYREKVPDDKRGDEGAKSCELAQKWMDKPTRFKVQNEAFMNSQFSDLAASYAKKDYKTVFFTSGRQEATGKTTDASWKLEKATDLFEVAMDKKGKWSTPKPLDPPVSTDQKEGTSALDKKGSDMYFTKCFEVPKTGTICKIYQTKKKGAAGWEDPKMLDFCGTDTSPVSYGHPTLSPDETRLFFSSNDPRGLGEHDIWMCTYDKKKKGWGEPVNLGPNVNTKGEELFPFIHADGTLYFSSDGHLGMGGLDIYSSKYDDKKKDWVKPENLKYPLNSSANDYAIVWEDESMRGYLTSDRAGGKGGDDIYSFVLPPLVFTLKVTVTDIDTKEPLENAQVTVRGTDGTLLTINTDKSGVTFFDKNVIKENTSYNVDAAKVQYFSNKGSRTTVGLEESTDLEIELPLKTQKKPIVLPNILYDLDKATLRPESMTSLDSLVKTLVENPKIVIELGSHTDIRATDKYNMELSQRRAESVVQYLISKGIDSLRLVARGYGESVPRTLQKDEIQVINSKDFKFNKGDVITEKYVTKFKEKDQQEAAHQLNRRTEFRVLRDDFVPKNQPAPAPDGTGGASAQPVVTPPAETPAAAPAAPEKKDDKKPADKKPKK